MIASEDLAILKPYLWDVDPDTVDLLRHKRFIIERLLHLGRPEQVRWVLRTYSDSDIADTVRRSKVMDRKTANYWALHLGIPREEVLCLNRQLMNPCFY